MALSDSDVNAIRNVLAGYSFGADSGDPKLFGAVFAEGFVLYTRGKAAATDDNTFRGHDDLNRLMRGRGAEVRTQHWMNGAMHIDGDGNTAHVKVYAALLSSGSDNAASIPMTGTYYSTLRKADGAWLIAEHEFVPTWP